MATEVTANGVMTANAGSPVTNENENGAISDETVQADVKRGPAWVLPMIPTKNLAIKSWKVVRLKRRTSDAIFIADATAISFGIMPESVPRLSKNVTWTPPFAKYKTHDPNRIEIANLHPAFDRGIRRWPLWNSLTTALFVRRACLLAVLIGLMPSRSYLFAITCFLPAQPVDVPRYCCG